MSGDPMREIAFADRLAVADQADALLDLLGDRERADALLDAVRCCGEFPECSHVVKWWEAHRSALLNGDPPERDIAAGRCMAPKDPRPLVTTYMCVYPRGHEGSHSWQDSDEYRRERMKQGGLDVSAGASMRGDPQATNRPDPITLEIAAEFPLLWERAQQFDFAERLGGCTDPLLKEIDAALRELWDARRHLRAIHRTVGRA